MIEDKTKKWSATAFEFWDRTQAILEDTSSELEDIVRMINGTKINTTISGDHDEDVEAILFDITKQITVIQSAIDNQTT